MRSFRADVSVAASPAAAIAALIAALDTALAPVRKVLSTFVPVLVSRGVVQVSAYVESMLASLLPTGAVAALEEAVRLHAGPGLPILYTLAEGVNHRDFEQPLEFLVRLPFMGIDLRSASLEADPRVHRAAPADLSAVDDLMTKAFELPEGLLREPLERLLADGGKEAGIWMLRHQGVPVSCVLTSVVDDLVTVWCMSTPPVRLPASTVFSSTHAMPTFGVRVPRGLPVLASNMRIDDAS